MAKYNVVVVDDKEEDGAKIVKFLEQIEDVNHVVFFQNSIEAYKSIEREVPDVLFLDIDMPDMTGLDLYSLLPLHKRPPVVLVTLHAQFAIEGIKLSVVDYLLKPVLFAHVKLAFQKAILSRDRTYIVDPFPEKEYRMFKVKDCCIKVVQYKDIIYVEALGSHIRVVTRNEEFTTRELIKEFKLYMPRTYFESVHRGFAVNMRFCSHINQQNKMVLTEKSPPGHIPLSRSFRYKNDSK